MEQNWEFTANWGGTGKLVTTIHAVDNILDIEQSKVYIFKFGSQKAKIDINEISEIITKKKISPYSALLALLGAVTICTGQVLYGGVLLVGGLCFLKTKYLCITHKMGLVKIQDTFGSSDERESFFNYIRTYNSDCIKVIIDN